MVEENHDRIAKAVQADLGGHKLRGVFDFVGVYEHAQYALNNIDSWTADIPVKHAEMLGGSVVRTSPKDLIRIIAPFNYPFDLVFSPLVSAIAAGNCAVLKPSEIAVNSAALVEELVLKYLDTSCIEVVLGAIPETTEL